MADVSSRKIRKSNFSPEEIEALVNTVGKHYNILYGEFAKRAINKHARHRVWLDVTKQVNRVSIERRTLQEVKNKWKKCQHLYKEQDKPDVSEEFEQKSTSEAKRRYGISESNIRRWRRLKDDIMEKASQARPTRKCKRANNTFETSIEDFDAFELSNSLDSMPLEQRLSKISTEEPVLQSQPLSPTKLKVTRQAAKLPHPSPKPPTPEPPNEEVCLRWNSHHSNMQTTFPNLLLREQYVDATLVAEGQTLKCHRLILSSCSPYFEEVLSGISPFQHPVLFMKDVPFWILKSLCDFMYAGEVHIFQNKLEELLAVAEMLKIKGLAGKQDGTMEEAKPTEPIKVVKEEKKEDREVKDKKSYPATLQQNDKRSSKASKLTYASKRGEKANKEPPKSDDILDPLDLLEPVYEELTKESKLVSTPAKFKETKIMPMKKSLPKKIKKRKLSEEREESPPPLFLSRKGTRSRPNVKIPKYYHTTYDRASKSMESPESTIVREPHTDQTDPLLQVEEIKAEPLDVEDDVIEIEDNVVGFSDQEMTLQEEEIIGNYDSPIVNPEENKELVGGEEEEETVPGFKKISLMQQPIIMDVHSIAEKPPNTLKIVDVTQLRDPGTTLPDYKGNDPLATEPVHPDQSKPADDPLNLNSDIGRGRSPHDITITNVETVEDGDAAAALKGGDKIEEPVKDCAMEGCHKEDGIIVSDTVVVNAADQSDGKHMVSEDCAGELGFQITNVVSGHFDELEGNDDGGGKGRVEEAEAEAVVNSVLAVAADAADEPREGSESAGNGAADNALSEETRLIANSLEELLEK